MATTRDRKADADARLEKLAREQGVRPVENLDQLIADFWPENETADDLLAAVREWRREGSRAAD